MDGDFDKTVDDQSSRPPTDDGMPAWMPLSALFIGAAIFAGIIFGTRALESSRQQPHQAAQAKIPAPSTGSATAGHFH